MDHNRIISGIGEFWDQRAAAFDMQHDTEDIAAWSSTLEMLLGDDKNQNVLDLGTGSGFLANMTSALGYPTLGVDLSTSMLRNGVRHAAASNLTTIFMKGNALDLPFMDKTLDNIVNARLLWTLVEPEGMIKEWFRILKPGGKLFCFNRMEDGIGLTTSKSSMGSIYQDESIDSELTIKDASMEELIYLLERNGYVDVQIQKLSGLTRSEFTYQSWYVLQGRKPVSPEYTSQLKLENFWNQSAKDYELTHSLGNLPQWQNTLSSLIGTNKDQKILDVGTGTGMFANLLGSSGYTDVTGADISEKMMRIALTYARANNTGVRFVYGNTLDLPFDQGSFDTLINARLLWTLDQPEKAFSEWYRVLKTGGKLIVIHELESDGIHCDSLESYKQMTGIDAFPFSDCSSIQIVNALKKAAFHKIELNLLPGCHLVSSEQENWFAFIAEK